MSGLGKGITAASTGRILKNKGYKVTAIKIDPYINIDAGTMSPFQHGEVYVLKDGGEADLDLGNYERFMDINLTAEHNITTGKIYKTVIEKERRGDYLGKTVQIIPISPTRSRSASATSPGRAARTSVWSRSAERWATSRACHSSRRSARCGPKRRKRTLPLFT